MKADAETIWQVPAYLPYHQPPLTSQIVRQAEQKIGSPLPSAYLELLERQNGGYIRFTLPNSVHNVIAGIGPFYPSLVDRGLEDYEEDVDFPLEGLFPLEGDGHWYLCLDYRRSPMRPRVTYIETESDGSQTQIADTFDGYLEQLVLIVEDELVLETAEDIKKVKTQLSKLFNTTFERPDRWSHGYPIYRTRLEQGERWGWIWLSPNLVPRGFAREKSSRFDELRKRMQGEAPRFPEIPESSCLLDVEEDFRQFVLERCQDAGITIRPLSDYFN